MCSRSIKFPSVRVVGVSGIAKMCVRACVKGAKVELKYTKWMNNKIKKITIEKSTANMLTIANN